MAITTVHLLTSVATGCRDFMPIVTYPLDLIDRRRGRAPAAIVALNTIRGAWEGQFSRTLRLPARRSRALVQLGLIHQSIGPVAAACHTPSTRRTKKSGRRIPLES